MNSFHLEKYSQLQLSARASYLEVFHSMKFLFIDSLACMSFTVLLNMVQNSPSFPPHRSRTAQMDYISQLPAGLHFPASPTVTVATWLRSSKWDIVEVMCTIPRILFFREAAYPPHLLSGLESGFGDRKAVPMRMTSQGAVEKREGRNLHPSMTGWITAAVFPTAWTQSSDFERGIINLLSYLNHSYFHLC